MVYPVSDGDYLQGLVTDGAGNISFDDIDIVRSDVTNQSGATIAKGTPVYQTGSAGNTLTIAPSDAAIPSTMPAIGVAATDIQNGDTGHVIHFGYIRGVDTSTFSEGDRIYVAVGGGYQAGRPTGESNVVQFLGVVTKVHATNGSGVVFGGGRSHAVPNLDNGNIFIGDSNDLPVTATLDTSIVPENTNLYFTDARAVTAVESEPHLTIDGGTLYVDTDNNYVGIGDTSPQGKLDVAGNIMVNGTEVISSTGVVAAAQLPTSGVTAGTYGSASLVPVLTVDDKGRITSASTTSVAGVSSFTYNSSTNVLNIGTADGGSFNANIGTIGGSLEGPLSNITVQYGVNYNGTPTQGSFYFDSLNQLWMVYTGSAWVQAVPGGGTTGGGDTTDAVATLEKFTYSIPSTTNSVQGTDDNGNTLAYVVDGSQNVEVFVNGIKQVEGAANDYVATTGTAVTFTYNLPAGSVVDVQVFELLTQDAFYLKSETYTKTETNSQISTALTGYLPLTGGTLTSDLTINGTATIYNPGGTSYNENIRLPAATSGYVSIGLGTDPNSPLGVNTDQWTLVRYPPSHPNTPAAFGIREGGGTSGTTDVFYARKNGSVAFPRMPYLLAWHGGVQSDITSGNVATLAYDQVDHDETGSWNPSTYVWTCPYTGIYEVEAKMWMNSNTAGTIYCYLYKNGSIWNEQRFTRPSVISEYHTFIPRFTLYASAGDTLYLTGEAAGGATLHRSSSRRYTHLTIKMAPTTYGG